MASHTDIYERDVSGKYKRVYLHISWDNLHQEYVLGIRVSLGAYSSHETIYFDRVTAKELSTQLAMALSLIRVLDIQEQRPLQNYHRALQLLKMALPVPENNLWGAHATENDDSLISTPRSKSLHLMENSSSSSSAAGSMSAYPVTQENAYTSL